MEKEKIVEFSEHLTREFLTQLGLDADIEVAVSDGSLEEQEVKYVTVKLTGENLNELIGFHGKTLSSLQNIMNLIFTREFKDQGYRLVLEVNDYKERRESYLSGFAKRAALDVKSSGQEMELEPMRAYERRIVHMTLKDDPEVETISIGEGDERRIVIRPKGSNGSSAMPLEAEDEYGISASSEPTGETTEVEKPGHDEDEKDDDGEDKDDDKDDDD